MSEPKIKDDLEALRVVIDAVQGLKPEEQNRVFRWAAEKLGLSAPSLPSSGQRLPAVPEETTAYREADHIASPATGTHSTKDIKSFYTQKAPKSDVQFASVVAYYYQFEAAQDTRKDSINAQDLQEACRLVSRARLKDPLKTLNNAHGVGLLDRGQERGTFVLSTVGENLVAMTLPGTQEAHTGKKAKRNQKVVRTNKPKKGKGK
jgi:hypothetical protein